MILEINSISRSDFWCHSFTTLQQPTGLAVCLFDPKKNFECEYEFKAKQELVSWRLSTKYIRNTIEKIFLRLEPNERLTSKESKRIFKKKRNEREK
jgi:hypothetical protein